MLVVILTKISRGRPPDTCSELAKPDLVTITQRAFQCFKCIQASFLALVSIFLPVPQAVPTWSRCVVFKIVCREIAILCQPALLSELGSLVGSTRRDPESPISLRVVNTRHRSRGCSSQVTLFIHIDSIDFNCS